jgi:hypothetical protein
MSSFTEQAIALHYANDSIETTIVAAFLAVMKARSSSPPGCRFSWDRATQDGQHGGQSD